MNYLAIDIGSSSGRVFLQDEKGNSTELARFPHTAYPEGEDFRWDIMPLFKGITEAVDKAIVENPVSSIGICSWGVDYGYLVDGKLMETPYCYRSKRNKRGYKGVHEIIDETTYFRRTGIFPNEINTVYQLFVDKEEGRIPKNARIGLIADLLAYFLTGNLYAEETNASTSGLLTLKGDWDFELFELLGIPRYIFPEIIRVGQTYGSYKGIPVRAVCTHDTASAVEAMNCERKGASFVASGSWLLIGKVVSVAVTTDKALFHHYTNELISKGKISLLKNINGLFVIQQLVRELNLSYREIDEKMPSAKLLGIVDTNGFLFPEKMAERLCEALGVKNPDPYDLIKTVYYSLANSLSLSLKSLDEITDDKTTELVLTGGATKAPYLIDCIKELCGVELRFAPTEGAIFGINKILTEYE